MQRARSKSSRLVLFDLGFLCNKTIQMSDLSLGG